MDRPNNKQMLLSVIGVAILLVAIVGISFALFSFTPAAGGANTVSTGTITMSYSEPSNGINIANALPTSDALGTTLSEAGQYFEFAVSTNASGNLSVPYEINITPVPVDGGKTALTDTQVKIHLTTSIASGGTEVAVAGYPKFIDDLADSTIRPGALVLHSVTDTHTVADSATSSVTYYTVRIYIGSNVNYDDVSGDRQYKLKVNVDSTINALTTP